MASAITIGSGGSGGREGPTAQISAGFGSFLSRILDLDARDARIAVAAGMAAGIGAIFRAPLGGAILGAEILYRDDVESDALVPAFIASIVAYSIFGAAVGFAPIFGAQLGARFDDPRQLVYYALIGIAAGLVGRLYIGTFYGLTDRFRRLRLAPMLRPALAGVAVGLIGLAIPGALGTGYGWVQGALGADLLGIPLWIVLVLPFAKILATTLTIGSGGSGGIFGPGMVDRRAARAPASGACWRPGRARPAGGARAVRDRGHDGALRQHRPRAAGGHADGGRDDRKPGHAGAGDDRGRAWRRWSSATGRSTPRSSPTAASRPPTASASRPR